MKRIPAPYDPVEFCEQIINAIDDGKSIGKIKGIAENQKRDIFNYLHAIGKEYEKVDYPSIEIPEETDLKEDDDYSTMYSVTGKENSEIPVEEPINPKSEEEDIEEVLEDSNEVHSRGDRDNRNDEDIAEVPENERLVDDSEDEDKSEEPIVI